MYLVFGVLRIDQHVTFSPRDSDWLDGPHDDVLMVDGKIGNTLLRLILVDDGSPINLMTLNVFKLLNRSTTDLKRVSTPLVGLGGISVPV